MCVFFSCGIALWKKGSGNAIDQQHKEWKDYGGGPDHSKFVDLKQITKSNVGQLDIAFVYPTSDNFTYRFNPIIVDNVMYVLAKNNSLVAVDATTGKEIWIHANLGGIISRGVNFWQSKDRTQKRLIIFLNNTMQAIDATTGKSIVDFGESGRGYTDMRQGLDRDTTALGRSTSSTPGHIFEDLILVGSAPGENLFDGPGHLRAYNVLTGKMAWIFHTIPHPGEYGYDTWPKDAYKYVGGTNAWGEISVDEKRGIAYYPLGSPTYDFDGADRQGSNLFGNCLLALDARTGKRLWHFQTVHHDLWDHDLTSAPQLITVKHDGKDVDAVAAASKNGFLYVLDRITGQPLWPIEEKPVPKSEVADQAAWPTQPIPTVVPPFNRQVITADDINPYLKPEDKERWIKRINAAKSALFLPFSDKHETLMSPGSIAGANFGNSASDPAKGIVYIQAQDVPAFYSLKKREVRVAPLSGDRLNRAQGMYIQTCQPCHGADRNGVTGLGTTLLNLAPRYNYDAFKQVVVIGKGRMPALPHLDEAAIAEIFAYLAPSPAGGPGAGGMRNPMFQNASGKAPEGPVVASGGVAIPTMVPRKPGEYPADHEGPKVTYIEANNFGVTVPDLLKPPFSSVVAYDLNKGTIKWKVPLGTDDRITDMKNTGAPTGSLGKGMVVTSTGILFATSSDGRVYAYDTDDGHVIWTGNLGRRNPFGIPAMYEANGKQYLVVCSTGGLLDKNKKEEDVPRGYIAFALPRKLKTRQ